MLCVDLHAVRMTQGQGSRPNRATRHPRLKPLPGVIIYISLIYILLPPPLPICRGPHARTRCAVKYNLGGQALVGDCTN